MRYRCPHCDHRSPQYFTSQRAYTSHLSYCAINRNNITFERPNTFISVPPHPVSYVNVDPQGIHLPRHVPATNYDVDDSNNRNGSDDVERHAEPSSMNYSVRPVVD